MYILTVVTVHVVMWGTVDCGSVGPMCVKLCMWVKNFAYFRNCLLATCEHRDIATSRHLARELSELCDPLPRRELIPGGRYAGHHTISIIIRIFSKHLKAWGSV
jgi:hypothetical protein